jgi:hypothetical protein
MYVAAAAAECLTGRTYKAVCQRAVQLRKQQDQQQRHQQDPHQHHQQHEQDPLLIQQQLMQMQLQDLLLLRQALQTQRQQLHRTLQQQQMNLIRKEEYVSKWLISLQVRCTVVGSCW